MHKRNLVVTLCNLLLLACCSLSFSQNDSIKKGPVTIGAGFTIDYQNPREYEIGPIRVVGADNFDHQAIKLLSGLRQGSRIMIPGDRFSTAIKNLWNEGIFSDIEIYLEKEIDGVVYPVIEVTPRPKLSRFKFSGVTRREADKIREEISLYSGKTITENLVFTTKSRIKGYYREKGYYSAQVDIKRMNDTLMNNSEVFLISIQREQGAHRRARH